MMDNRPTRDMLNRWKPVLVRIREASKEGTDPKAGFKIAAEYCLEDADFLAWWRKEVEKQPEPVRGRAISFLNRLARRGPNWDFDKEFRGSFN